MLTYVDSPGALSIPVILIALVPALRVRSRDLRPDRLALRARVISRSRP